MAARTRRDTLLLLALLLAGFALRLFRLDVQSIWWDEAHTWIVTQWGLLRGSWDLPVTVSFNHVPLYFVLMTGWVRLAGDSLFALRAFSALIGMLTPALAYLLARDLLGRRAGLAALAVLTFSPMQVLYAQEARPYVLLPALYLAMLIVVGRLARQPEGTSGSPRFSLRSILPLSARRGEARAEMPPERGEVTALPSPVRTEKGGPQGRKGTPAPRRLWILLALLEALALYSHFFMAMPLLYLNLWLLVLALRRRIRVRAWLLSQLAAALSFVPWLINMSRAVDLIIGGVGGTTERPALLDTLARAARFTLAGNPGVANGSAPLRAAMIGVGIAVALALLLLLADARRRRPTLILWLHGLAPLAITLLVLALWPQAQPRYTINASAPLFAAAGASVAVLLAGRPWERLAGAGLAICAAWLAVVGLNVGYFDEAYFKDDARSAAAYLEQVTGPHDLILFSAGDYSVPYYYDGPARVVRSSDASLAEKGAQLAAETADRGAVYLVIWDPEVTDLHGLRAWALERAGGFLSRQDFHGYTVEGYRLDQPVRWPPDFTPLAVGAGPLRLTGVAVDGGRNDGDALTVALRWRLDAPGDARYRASLRLIDAAGETLGTVDATLYDELNRTTRDLPAGTESMSFFTLPVPVGSPAVPGELALVIYDARSEAALHWRSADTLDLPGVLRLAAAPILPGAGDADPYATRAGLTWADPPVREIAPGLALTGVAAPALAGPGQPVEIWLRWQALPGARPAALPFLVWAAPSLVSSQHAPIEVPAVGAAALYPPDAWIDGEVIIERRPLVYQPVRGPAVLALHVGDQMLEIGHLALDERGLLWDLPAQAQPIQGGEGVPLGDLAALAGYTIEGGGAAGQPFTVTLYWRALRTPPQPYTAFVHLLTPDGRLIAQHDGLPGGAARPVTTWVPGELIPDPHPVEFLDPGYVGPVRLVAGLYDPATVQRLTAPNGADSLPLPGLDAVK